MISDFHKLVASLPPPSVLIDIAKLQVCCSVLQCIAVRCSVFQCVATYCSALQCMAVLLHKLVELLPLSSTLIDIANPRESSTNVKVSSHENVCIYEYMCSHVFIYTFILHTWNFCMDGNVYMYICINMFISIRIHICIRIKIFIYMHICIDGLIYICMYVHIYVYTCIHIYMDIYV